MPAHLVANRLSLYYTGLYKVTSLVNCRNLDAADGLVFKVARLSNNNRAPFDLFRNPIVLIVYHPHQ
jgi:hypothetical protein